MAEQSSPVEVPATSAVDPIKTELDQQMAISLNGGIPPTTSDPAAVSASTEVPSTATTSDPFGIFKEKFGYDTPEAAVQDIESLRAFRAAPPAAELNFENPQSKLVAEALQAGKFQEVYEVLDQQMRIERLTSAEMTTDIATDIVKLGMQLKYKDLTPAEITYKFNKQFALPAKPALLPAEDQEEYNERLATWEAQKADKDMELMIEAKLAKPELQNSKTKLVFPTIARPQDADFQEWQKTVQDNDRLAAETTQAYKAFTPTSLETKIHFKDEPNKIDFEYTHEPDPQSFNQAIEMVSDINQFWKSFISSDGTPNRKDFLETIYFGLNRHKILMDAMSQAKNATIKASLPDNSTGGLVRQMPQTQEPNELDRLMRESLKGYGGF
jgi:hypothetical protein